MINNVVTSDDDKLKPVLKIRRPQKKVHFSTDEINEEFVREESDNGSILVIILQCETRPCNKNIYHLKWVFSDPYFTVHVCAVDPPSNIQTNNLLTEEEYIENYYMRKALNYAAEGPYIANNQQILEPQI